MVTAEHLRVTERPSAELIARRECVCGRKLTDSGLCVRCDLPQLLELTQRV